MQPVWVILEAVEIVKGRHPQGLVTPQPHAIRVKGLYRKLPKTGKLKLASH